ncbi:cytochrome b/b6 domain-containing protein [Acuticoccus sp. I52.16.1]|uniref:cytochrome b/b6 domain-containing protein n=1 Tax=Acuticoccus sp. I52.16.1 TaxID=2928472 RepID=UPI001FD5B356|nr:cytochrome b/b6 domain-containing protein [Acuticoccus sp. I52.16.1]UOM35969.1 cytochrome b/b6 domain-containing protein [Acuticoccus sp. I52.16.1]
MPTTTEPPFRASRYTTGAIVLHWTIAILVILQIAGGFTMEALAERGSALQYTLFQLHKSMGATVLVLTVARILWRAFNPPPAEPASVSRMERVVAGIVHKVFYLLLLVIPLAGWVVITVSPIQIETVLYFQSWLPWPHLPGFGGLGADARANVEDIAGDVHVILAYAMGVLVLLHIAGAVKHQMENGRYLRRMTGFSGGDGPRNAYGQATTVVATLVFGGAIIGSAGIARHEAALARAPAAVSPDEAEVLGSAAAQPPAPEPAPAGPTPEPETATTETEAADTLQSAAAPEEPAGAVSGAPVDVAAVQAPEADAPEADTPVADAPEAAAEHPAPEPAAVPQWTVRPGESALTIRFGYQSGEVVARFESFDADIAFDPADLDASSIRVAVDLTSVTIDSGGVPMAQLRGPDGLAVDAAATATFTSRRIRQSGDGSYVADGELDLRGTVRPIALAFDLAIDGDVARADAGATLERLDYTIGARSDPTGGTVALEVTVAVDVVADRR